MIVAFTHRIDCDLDDDCWCVTGDSIAPVSTLASFLDANHYLGATSRGIGWSDDHGVLVLALPTSRRLPHDGTWLELSRWCLLGEKNAGSRQWKAVRRWLRANMPEVTTVVSYSDPSQGHTGALYKACNWLWAPTWLRLRPPPSGNGSWVDGQVQAVKDRWVFPLRPDPRRAELLRVNDEALNRRGVLGYQEPERLEKSIRSGLHETPAKPHNEAPTGLEPVFQSAELKADT